MVFEGNNTGETDSEKNSLQTQGFKYMNPKDAEWVDTWGDDTFYLPKH